MLVTGMLLGILGFASCNKQLDIDSSRQANEEGHWTKYEDARSGLMGMYGLFRAAVADNNAHWLLGELRGGDFLSLSRPALKAIIDGNLNASYPAIQNITDWRRFYAIINACNLFIERVEGCKADKRYTNAYYKLDIAQARAIRAFAYFYMVRIWGDLPLITKTNEGTFEALPRSSQDVVLAFAEQELIAVSPNLPYLYSSNDGTQTFPDNYYGATSGEWLNTPLNKLAAYALLAHIAAWRSQYIDVAIYTEFIINNYGNSNLYGVTTSELVSSTGLFNTTTDNYNQLIGFNFIKNRGETTASGHIEQLTLANTTRFAMSKQMPDIYIPKDTISVLFPSTNGNDERFGTDTTATPPLVREAYFENYSAEIPVFKKIKVINGGDGSNNNFAGYNSAIVFTRLEEIRLLRAEALAVLSQNDAAREQLNNVRTSRGIKAVSSAPGTDLITEIFLERRRELAGEGWRWYDLVRYNKIKRTNPAFNQLIDRGGIYWPIAQDVLNRNPKLVQNAYWK